MQAIKKLLFSLPAMFFLVGFLVSLSPFFKDYSLIFGLSFQTLIQMLSLCGLILLTSTYFVIFVTLANSWAYIAPIALVLSLTPLGFYPPRLGVYLSLGILISLSLISLFLLKDLKSYFNFDPKTILKPPTRNLSTLLALVVTIVFYLNTSSSIKEKGFEIPDSLIDPSLSLMQSNLPKLEEESAPVVPNLSQISTEQIELLKQNPQLLKQYGLDPKILDTLQPTSTKEKTNTKPATKSTDLYKGLIKSQLQKTISPYQDYIPAILGFLFFITLTSSISLLSLLLSPLLWITFSVLEKIGFTKYVVEMREVKKLVV